MERETPSKQIRLNKFISHAGVCARRAADILIQSGHITVNGRKVNTLGYKVTPQDVVHYRNQVLKTEKHVYILLNKPKNYITTTKDEKGRRTVLQLVQHACQERVYPVGRLDCDTTGLLLFTNDGALSKKLTHPSSNIKKLYHVVLDKPISQADCEKIRRGIVLEDGVAYVDQLEIVGQDRSSIGLEIHMGRNRIIRRIFEHLHYGVIKLDRVMYAHLTKKDLPRGKWRLLTQQEVKYFNRY
ncbi:MAG: rRNA pseudouridine synthase [Amoebophilaceae bacterium]|nr:rRNA pseudouridine synthase [Amoebophilaceae bacterium]